MEGTLVERILKEHLADGELRPGKEVSIRIDDTLTQDATGTMAWLQFEATGVSHVRTRAVSVIDHNTVQMGPENADDHNYLQSVARKYGAILSKAGNGICHQVFLEGFAAPGKTLIGSDSHTPTAGAMGELGIGVGGLDVALAMAGQPYWLKTPQVYGICLNGRLREWVTAKDVIIRLIQEFGTSNKDVAFEYFGGGVTTLTVPERATIANMGAELGATTSIFPSDIMTLEFLRILDRERDYQPMEAETSAKYNRVFELDLSSVEPMVILPPEKGMKGLGRAAPLKEAIGKKVNQVCIGACTNSSYHDLTIAGALLKTKRINKDVELIITPGSKAIMQLIIENGSYRHLSEAGARFTEPVCGPCIGQGYSPSSAGVRVATFNRNFCGRSGTKDAQIYLASPEVAAAAAFSGEIQDPRELFKDMGYTRFSPEKFPDIYSTLLFYGGDPKAEAIRGPNIHSLPENTALADTINGLVVIKLGDRITTDDIAPAGGWLKHRSNIQEYSKAVFSNIEPSFYERAMCNLTKGRANIIIAGEGYGEGSSREHAAICPMFLGVKAVLAKGFQRIHADNLVNFGIIPLIFGDGADYQRIEQGDELRMSNIRPGLKTGSLKLENITKDISIELTHELSDRKINILYCGGALNYAKGKSR